MVLSVLRERANRTTTRVAWVLERLGLSPNAVTIIALVVTGLGALLVAERRFIEGALVAGLGAALDAMDGALARRMDRVSTFGGYLDSLLDRYADGFVFLAVAWAYDETWIWAASFVAFLGAAATSYAKARAYQDARPPPNAWPDLLERPERLLLLLVTIGFQGISEATGRDVQFLPWLVVGLAVLGHVTVVQRALRARRFLAEADLE